MKKLLSLLFILLLFTSCEKDAEKPKDNAPKTNEEKIAQPIKPEIVEPEIVTPIEPILSDKISAVLSDNEPIYNLTYGVRKYFCDYGYEEIYDEDFRSSSYNIFPVNYALVDMDNDGKNEILVEDDLIREYENEVYCYSPSPFVTFRGKAKDVFCDGTFSFISPGYKQNEYYGLAKLKFEGRNLSVVELWKVETDESGKETYYIEGTYTSKGALEEYQKNFTADKVEFSYTKEYSKSKFPFDYVPSNKNKKEWSADIATKFKKGEGTKDSPYVIKTPSELAFMAKNINSGNDIDKYFVLGNDIDLCDAEWVPIGNYDFPFKGNFDGKGYTIKNMTVMNPTKYDFDDSNPKGLAGFFGAAEGCVINNVRFENARVYADAPMHYESLYMGVVIGRVNSGDTVKISNVSLVNCDASPRKTIPFASNGSVSNCCVGGIIGRAEAYCEITRVEIDLISDCIDSQNNYVGSVVGMLMQGIECTDVASYMTLKLGNGYSNFTALIGYINRTENTIKLSNIYSEIKSNVAFIPEISNGKNNTTFFNSNSIIGKLSNKSRIIETEIKNVFGCVKPLDKYSGFDEPRFELYTSPKNDGITIINSKGCAELPENHGFDLNIWDVSDLKKPRLK